MIKDGSVHMNYGRTYTVTDLDAIKRNTESVRSKIGSKCRLLTVVKADAYGHGAVMVSKALGDVSDFFGVASAAEGIQLRKSGIANPILVLGYSDDYDIKNAIEEDISLSVFSLTTAKKISDEAKRLGRTAKIHIAVDTGMSRIGFFTSMENALEVKRISELEFIRIEGIFSHFAEADEEDLSKAVAQREKFCEFIEKIEKLGVNVGIRHINNSGAIMNFDESFDMVRSGIVTYGMYPSKEVNKEKLRIEPALCWKTHVFCLKNIKKGTEISYGGTYEATRDTVIATLPVGYADGYPRCLSNKGKVLIRGRFAPIVGRVCMDFMMVDVTDIKDVKEGDTVTLVGKDGESFLSMEEVADEAYSFNYELPCRITRRVTRVYKSGEEITVQHNI